MRRAASSGPNDVAADQGCPDDAAADHGDVDDGAGGSDRLAGNGLAPDELPDDAGADVDTPHQDRTGRVAHARRDPARQRRDASTRLRTALAEADVIAAEDTRRVRSLAAALGVSITGQVLSHYDAVEAARLPGLLADARAGRTVLMVTDAGMPSVSDPGYRLVAAATAERLQVTCLSGPSAVTTALVLSGLPVERFCFDGFAPRKPGTGDAGWRS